MTTTGSRVYIKGQDDERTMRGNNENDDLDSIANAITDADNNDNRNVNARDNGKLSCTMMRRTTITCDKRQLFVAQ